jgi:hypothetical protein
MPCCDAEERNVNFSASERAFIDKSLQGRHDCHLPTHLSLPTFSNK